uniref:Uncharacterized protein n=1 Tax=Timema poppense TaxID=170557 RepID=A0A7R9HES4_TIMPO|nr:unnamed protein product [Timema poppensis]
MLMTETIPEFGLVTLSLTRLNSRVRTNGQKTSSNRFRAPPGSEPLGRKPSTPRRNQVMNTAEEKRDKKNKASMSKGGPPSPGKRSKHHEKPVKKLKDVSKPKDTNTHSPLSIKINKNKVTPGQLPPGSEVSLDAIHNCHVEFPTAIVTLHVVVGNTRGRSHLWSKKWRADGGSMGAMTPAGIGWGTPDLDQHLPVGMSHDETTYSQELQEMIRGNQRKGWGISLVKLSRHHNVASSPAQTTPMSDPHELPDQTKMGSRRVLVPKNDTPNKFWLSVEPYCADILPEDIKLLDMMIQEHDQVK